MITELVGVRRPPLGRPCLRNSSVSRIASRACGGIFGVFVALFRHAVASSELSARHCKSKAKS